MIAGPRSPKQYGSSAFIFSMFTKDDGDMVVKDVNDVVIMLMRDDGNTCDRLVASCDSGLESLNTRLVKNINDKINIDI